MDWDSKSFLTIRDSIDPQKLRDQKSTENSILIKSQNLCALNSKSFIILIHQSAKVHCCHSIHSDIFAALREGFQKIKGEKVWSFAIPGIAVTTGIN